MNQNSAPHRSWRVTPAVGVIALLAALAGGAVAALVTVSVDGGSRRAETVTVHELSTATAHVSPTQLTDAETAASTTTSTGTQLTLEEIYKADARGVVSVITTTANGVEQGSGIVLDTSGYILTNQHVVEGQRSVRVSFSNHDNVKAKVIGTDASTDLALLKVDLPASALHPLPLGESSSVQVGDAVVAIGSPFGLEGTVTSGIVSALHREMTSPNHFAIDNSIQTDAAINHGNSGGPLLNVQGKVVGVNSQIESNSGGNEGVGFAIPSDTVRSIAAQLISSGKAEHAFLGVVLRDSSAQIGAAISQVRAGTPAAGANLRAGDIVTAAAGTRINSASELRAVINAHRPGDTISVTYKRGAQSHTVKVKLAARPAA
jgi:putative serine protease PepD